MYTEEQFKTEVKLIHKDKFEIISRFKGVSKPILIKDKFGVLELKQSRQLLVCEPTIAVALNKTEYFMNQLKDKYPIIADNLNPISEYVNARTKMLFDTKFGIVSATPDTLLAGHEPNIRSAIDRKNYFYNQLKYLYQDYDYDFIVSSTDRHKGKVILQCPIHGNQEIDSDWIFSGCGCPKCNKDWNKSNILYLIELYNTSDKFYKLGISYKTKSGDIRRFRDYKSLGYDVNQIIIKEFDDFAQCVECETKLKRLIKNQTYTPIVWENKTSTECFKENLLNLIIDNINLYMI